jgi:8-oxo-dGTP pyrophosphatase MutT (NUDIX family)
VGLPSDGVQPAAPHAGRPKLPLPDQRRNAQVVILCTFGGEQHVLVQLRSPGMVVAPSAFGAVGGQHEKQHKNSVGTAIAEVGEETGIAIVADQLTYLGGNAKGTCDWFAVDLSGAGLDFERLSPTTRGELGDIRPFLTCGLARPAMVGHMWFPVQRAADLAKLHPNGAEGLMFGLLDKIRLASRVLGG